MTAATARWWNLPPIDRRGSVAVTFAVAALPVLMATGVAVDMSRLTAGRNALQRAADSAALSGAAAYVLYTHGDTYNAVAVKVAASAFCNATRSLPAGLSMQTIAGGVGCGVAEGPAISAVVAGYQSGRRGTVPNSGCGSTNTVLPGVTCGFVVTVSATASMSTIMPGLFGATASISATASAVNPFVNLGSALNPSLLGSSTYANSLWVYPLLLDANGKPDFVTNPGALPDTSACTGAPSQAVCGSYTMLASTAYVDCTSSNPCTVDRTIFGGAGGVVQNPVNGNAIITATTPLGFAFEAIAGGKLSYGYYPSRTLPNGCCQPPDGCYWPYHVVYNTVTQVYDASNQPLLVDSDGRWTLPTHWFYSSYLANGLAPSQGEINTQLNTAINSSTGLAYNVQDVPPVTGVTNGVNTPATCANASAAANHQHLVTSYPTSGATNCSLYIVEDSQSFTPDPSYKNHQKCFVPTDTPGAAYAAFSCQSFGSHYLVFFWNDMGGGGVDDTDYGNGTLIVGCHGPSSVLLIN